MRPRKCEVRPRRVGAKKGVAQEPKCASLLVPSAGGKIKQNFGIIFQLGVISIVILGELQHYYCYLLFFDHLAMIIISKSFHQQLLQFPLRDNEAAFLPEFGRRDQLWRILFWPS